MVDAKTVYSSYSEEPRASCQCSLRVVFPDGILTAQKNRVVNLKLLFRQANLYVVPLCLLTSSSSRVKWTALKTR